ncbi:GNAT family N-acetyltransferase [Zavarzinella formosa]|uniref:GNAT family N-acetyltransferase n=1 Tax=Zavarzinella formosa TaxID=360055 RepID=UPI0003030C7D|nr:GNAT family N-acetyltransferase [Zavarzinella formosa]
MFEQYGLRLRKMDRGDLADLLELKNESWRYRHQTPIVNMEDQVRWYESLRQNDIVLIAMSGDKSIGVFKIFGIDWPSRVADVGWDVFAKHRGQGLGKLLVKTGVDFCIQILNLRRLDCEILEDNIRSIRCGEAAGFVEEGRKRSRIMREGRAIDSIVFGFLISRRTPSPRVNYVIATWSGERRDHTPESAVYIETHIKSLQSLAHSLTQVTVVIPHNPEEPFKFSAIIESLPKSIGSAQVQVLRRSNSGLSYGSYSDAYGRFRRAFDYYIFIEDDYMFAVDDFDRHLISMFDAKSNCGLLCGLVSPIDGLDHGAISNGITTSRVLEDLWSRYGQIPHAAAEPEYSSAHQIEFTRSFMHNGRQLCDVTDKFHVEFNDMGVWKIYGDSNLPRLMKPIHKLSGPKPLTVLILLLYHERPLMVRNALLSVLRASRRFPCWELAFIDDRSSHAGEPVARDILKDHLGQVRFINIPQDGEPVSSVGKYMNKAIVDSSADIAFILCDDDELHPDYLFNISNYFETHPEESSCYSLVHLYNPAWESSEHVDNITGPLNSHRSKINASCQVDASQVAWRTSVNKRLDAWFDYPRTSCLDAGFFQLLAEKTGGTSFSGFVAQYKGIHSGQLTYGPEAALAKRIDVPHVRISTPISKVTELITHYRDIDKKDAVEKIMKIALEVFPENIAQALRGMGNI